MSDRVPAAVRRAIEERGPIPFSEFMEMALYGPGGFYEQPPVGEAGHFITSPHVHPVFGELLARGLREMWESLGRPVPFDVVEAGAGDGTLARELLRHLKDVPVRYVAVERSPGGRERLAELRVDVADGLEAVGKGVSGCVIANELLDNLPFERVRRTPEGLVQVWVDVAGDRLVAVERPMDPTLGPIVPNLAPGEEAAVSSRAVAFAGEVARVLASGYGLLIDYGEATGRSPGPIHGYLRHRAVDDVFANPGASDITAGVNFRAIIEAAKESELETLGPVSQRSALAALGFSTWNEEERRRQVELLDRREGMDAIRAFGSRSRASLLLDPAGLGGLNWLALKTKDSEWPTWLEEAEAREEP